MSWMTGDEEEKIARFVLVAAKLSVVDRPKKP